MTLTSTSQQVLGELLSSPQGNVYSIKAIFIRNRLGLSNEEIEYAVRDLRVNGYRITCIHSEKHGIKRIQMNQNEYEQQNNLI